MTIHDEIFKALLNLAVTTVGLLLTWLIGQRVAIYWAAEQKKRELELTLVNQFYTNYGEFRAVWKLWNLYFTSKPDADKFAAIRDELLKRACATEGAIEAALLKVASERRLTAAEREDLANLRQAFQVLHERIRDNIRISYRSSDSNDYLEFKRLAIGFGRLLVGQSSKRTPTAGEAFQAFREITSNRYETRWHQAGLDPAHETQPRRGNT